MPTDSDPSTTVAAPRHPGGPATVDPPRTPAPRRGTLAERVDPLTERVHATADGLTRLVAEAEAVQRRRAAAAKERGAPRWTDVFTTQFTEFSNRPR
jgi:hypothetical protein